jgi:hypothetical protein
MTRGMAAWIHALQAIPVPAIVAARGDSSSYSDIPSGIKDEMVRVFANILLKKKQEVAHVLC